MLKSRMSRMRATPWLLVALCSIMGESGAVSGGERGGMGRGEQWMPPRLTPSTPAGTHISVEQTGIPRPAVPPLDVLGRHLGKAARRLTLRGGGEVAGSVRDLYGGAMKIMLPPNYDDVSDFRPVPDNQEVFADRVSNDSIIIEILESIESREERKAHEEKNGGTMPPPQDCRELQEEGDEPYDPESAMAERLEEGRAAAEIIFWDIANCTESEKSHVVTMRRLRKEEAPLVFERIMCPSEWITMWVVSGSQRIKKFRSPSEPSTDVLLHVFVARLPNVDSEVVITLNQPLEQGQVVSDRYEDGLDLLLRCVKTLQIRNWSFFGGDPNDI